MIKALEDMAKNKRFSKVSKQLIFIQKRLASILIHHREKALASSDFRISTGKKEAGFLIEAHFAVTDCFINNIGEITFQNLNI